MFSGKIPFHDVNMYDLKPLLQRGERPSLPADDLSRRRGLGPKMTDLIRDCWTQEPTKRPSADEVVERLQLLQLVDQRPPDVIETSISAQLDSNIVIQNPSDSTSTPCSNDNVLPVNGQRPEPIGSDYQAVHSKLSTTQERHDAQDDAVSKNPQKTGNAFFKGASGLSVVEQGPERTGSGFQAAHSSLSKTEKHTQDNAQTKTMPIADPLPKLPYRQIGAKALAFSSSKLMFKSLISNLRRRIDRFTRNPNSNFASTTDSYVSDPQSMNPESEQALAQPDPSTISRQQLPTSNPTSHPNDTVWPIYASEQGPEPTGSKSQVAYSSLSTTEEHAQDSAKPTSIADPLSEVRDISN
jgi:hypothetical protein